MAQRYTDPAVADREGFRCLINLVPPFFRIIDADPRWRHYLFGRQRPETPVGAMSWYWRFLLMMTLVRQLNWTCKFKESGLSTI